LKWKGTFHFDRGYYYFRNVGEDRFLLGGARSLNIDVETTTEFGVNEIIKNHLIDFASTVLKLPEGWEIDQEWSGIMGFTKTKSPVLERAGEKCLVVAGLSGMGVALGMQLGKEAVEMIE
ncbi:MAG: FAD-dependent oxidoreductase, partial [Balneolaceae bacterium]